MYVCVCLCACGLIWLGLCRLMLLLVWFFVVGPFKIYRFSLGGLCQWTPGIDSMWGLSWKVKVRASRGWLGGKQRDEKEDRIDGACINCIGHRHTKPKPFEMYMVGIENGDWPFIIRMALWRLSFFLFTRTESSSQNIHIINSPYAGGSKLIFMTTGRKPYHRAA